MSRTQGQNEAVGQEIRPSTAARLILTESGISPRGELDGSEECR